MTSLAKKIPVATGLLLFGVAACVAMVKGAELPTALVRGILAGAAGTLFAWFPAYLIFDEPVAQPKAPPGMESMEDQFNPKKADGQ